MKIRRHFCPEGGAGIAEVYARGGRGLGVATSRYGMFLETRCLERLNGICSSRSIYKVVEVEVAIALPQTRTNDRRRRRHARAF